MKIKTLLRGYTHIVKSKIVDVDHEMEPFNIVIPNKSLDELAKILDYSDGEVEFYIAQNKFSLR